MPPCQENQSHKPAETKVADQVDESLPDVDADHTGSTVAVFHLNYPSRVAKVTPTSPLFRRIFFIKTSCSSFLGPIAATPSNYTHTYPTIPHHTDTAPVLWKTPCCDVPKTKNDKILCMQSFFSPRVQKHGITARAYTCPMTIIATISATTFWTLFRNAKPRLKMK